MSGSCDVGWLEDYGRERLSPSFFMRDFLFSEVASVFGVCNVPEHPEVALRVGRQLCINLLEPLNATFGRLTIRSGYRSSTVNELCFRKGYNCSSNEENYAGHIWDIPHPARGLGGTVTVVVPWFADRYAQGADWRAMAWWVHNHLPYAGMEFFPRLCAFNISWGERPLREIVSFIEPHTGLLALGDPPRPEFDPLYADFPPLRLSEAEAARFAAQ